MNEKNAPSAHTILEKQYGLTGKVTPLPGEYDKNFHLQTENGEQFVLKIMHEDRTRKAIEMQIEALNHLSKRLPSLPLPRIVLTRDQEPTFQYGRHFVWLITYLPGTLYAKTGHQSGDLRHHLGQTLGQLDMALKGFDHPAIHRPLKWNLAEAGWIADHLDVIDNEKRRALVNQFLSTFQTAVSPSLSNHPKQAIHNDANDYNLLVQHDIISGLFDFGDLVFAPRICELAIAAAYALMGQADPLAAASELVAGYHQRNPLNESELELLFNLIAMRLCVSVVVSAQRKKETPDDPYLTISEAPAWNALEKLSAIHPRFAHYTFRAACGLPPVPQTPRIESWLVAQTFASVLDIDLQTAPNVVFDLSAGSLLLGANPEVLETAVFSRLLEDEIAKAGAVVGIGRYDEPRLIYRNENFTDGSHPTQPRRTVHLGIDLFVPADTPLYAPLAGTVFQIDNNTLPLDYGPFIILEHQTSDGDTFYTVYGHLSERTLSLLAAGQLVSEGEQIGWIGPPPINGDWPPHLHFQIVTDLLELDRDFPGVAYPHQRAIWRSLVPDANLILKIPASSFPPADPSPAETLASRREKIGRNLSLSYHKPLKIVRGWKQYLYDAEGQAYLDMYNNVPHVGHSHPRVVQAVQRQIALLNTNTRYLHDNIIRYANRLTSLFPDPLSVCFFVNSGSEANELALRLARAATQQEDILVLEGAYHGHTSGLIDISPYKFAGPGGQGAKPWVHMVPVADDYRGLYKRNDPQAGKKYAQHVAQTINNLQEDGRGFAAFIAESLPSVGGQIVFPDGYLTAVYQHVRAAGGITIADEVQTGFGRLGTHFWGFEMQGVTPDIIVLGKPIGNAFPLAAVITTPQIAKAFDNGMEFFSTFGGNPVACAAGLAVLDVLEAEELQAHARKVGDYLIDGLRTLQTKHDLIGDVRGSGLFLGVELVRDRETLSPAASEASQIVNRLREQHILAGTDGPLHNVLKLRPPMPFTQDDAHYFLQILATIFETL